MFDAERLLGQLMGDAMSGGLGGRRRRREPGLGGLLSGGTKAKLGLGLLGLAFAAYEHYRQPPNVSAPGTATPPPPPASPPPAPTASLLRSEQALHLVRAMVCAANADGLIDADERQGILDRAREAGLTAGDIAALDVEIRAPMSLEQLVVRTPGELRDEVYAAALIAITADTGAERAFLDHLATQLQLDEGARREIHGQLGLA